VADAALLRQRLEAELDRFKERARTQGVTPSLVDSGHHALCALLDDAVHDAPWARKEPWCSAGLAAALHGDRSEGERFFELMGKARADPIRTRPLLELMDACLAMGLQGRFHRTPGGAAALINLRTDLGAKLASMIPAGPDGLSPSWRAAPAPRRWLGGHVPMWVGGVAALTLLALVYVGFDQRLGTYSERLGPIIARLAPPIGASTDAAGSIPALTPLGRRLAACLSTEEFGPDAISDGADRLRVRLAAASLFRPRHGDLFPRARPALRCLGNELGKVSGNLLVVGHTDDTPSASPRFPSNWELSQVRASEVGRALLANIDHPRRIIVQGRADAEPRASNAEAQGRARNGRVEILLLK
jgi:type VI secretion system protein ImpK